MRAPRASVFVLFQHQHAGAVTQHEPVALLVPRTRCSGGVVVARGHRLHGAEPAHRTWGRTALGATGQHHVGIAVLDHAHRSADRMVGGGAGRHGRERRALQAFDQAHLARQHVDDGAGHIERRNLARAALMQFDGLLFDAEQPADTGAQNGAHAFGIAFVDLQPGIVQRHERGADTVVDERIHLLDVLGGHKLGGIEILDLARDPGGELRGIDLPDRANARATVDDPIPTGGQIIAQRRHHAHAGNDNTTTHCRSPHHTTDGACGLRLTLKHRAASAAPWDV